MISEILNKKCYFLPKHEHEGGATKETHFAFYKNKKYVLRICNDGKSRGCCHDAFKYFSKNNILPKLLEEKDNVFLIEFVKGRDLREDKPEPLRIIDQVGRIAARVNKVGAKFEYKKYLKKYLKYLSKNKVLSNKKMTELKCLLSKLSRVNLKTCLDVSDLTADNFRVSSGKVYLVDIGAIKPKFAGFGITKAFVQWIKTEKQRKSFEEGYSSVSSMDFYSGDYRKLSQLFFVIQVLYYKHLQKKDVGSYLKRLEDILSSAE